MVIVTGGAKGIGTGITRALAQERAVPVILDRDTGAAESLRAELSSYGSVSHFIEIDLCSAADCAAAIERTLSVANRLDALVNNLYFPGFQGPCCGMNRDKVAKIGASTTK